jgi:microcystin-dependent protein
MGVKMDGYLGQIIIWPTNWAPEGWSMCAGQQLLVQQNAALFSIIGTYYGGNPSTNFNLPNLTSRVPVGFAMGSPGALPAYTLASTIGTASTTLNMNNLPPHVHPASFAPIVGPQVVNIPAAPASGSLAVNVSGKLNTNTAGMPAPSANANVYLGGVSAAGGPDPIAVTGPYNATQAPTTANLQGLAASVTPSPGYSPGSPASTATISAVVGGSVAIGANSTTGLGFSNVQPSLAVAFIICVSGLYPPRP